MADLYYVASQIKNVNSPVFGSKLCHFIVPDAFPVIDSKIIKKGKKAIGASALSYEDYWRFCKSQWGGCSAQTQSVQTMRAAIGSNIFIHYPYAVKITELCIRGALGITRKTARRNTDDM